MDFDWGIGLLGPVVVTRDNVLCDLPAGRPRALLAALALSAGSPVEFQTLKRSIWAAGRDVQDHSLHTLAKELRNALHPDKEISKRIVTTLGGAYQLNVPVDAVDVRRFEALAVRGDSQLSSGERERAVTTWSQALNLWRGEEALPGLGRSDLGTLLNQRTRLEKRRLDVAVKRARQMLALGQVQAVVADLTPWVDRHPENGELVELLMTSLALCGRGREAVAVLAQPGVVRSARLVEVATKIRHGELKPLSPRDAMPSPIPPPSPDPGPQHTETARRLDTGTGAADSPATPSLPTSPATARWTDTAASRWRLVLAAVADVLASASSGVRSLSRQLPQLGGISRRHDRQPRRVLTSSASRRAARGKPTGGGENRRKAASVAVVSVLALATIAAVVLQALPVAPRESDGSPPIPEADGDLPPRSEQPLPGDALIWRHDDGTGSWSTAVLSLQGRSLQVLKGPEAVGPVLTPDRRSVLYIERSGNLSSLGAVAADGTLDKRLFAEGSPECPRLRRPAVRADGVIVAVCGASSPEGEDRLNVMTLEGLLLRTLDRGHLGDPSLSPDGTTVVYVKGRTGDPREGGTLEHIPGQLYRTSVDAVTPPVQLGTDVAINPVVSPAGQTVAYERIDGESRAIATVGLAGSGPGRGNVLTPVEATDRDPSWSPDGTRLVFRRMTTATQGDLYLMQADGTGQVPIAGTHGRLGAPVWTSR